MLYRSRAPLRLGLAGGGTDVSPYCDLYGGYVLNATISLFSSCTLETGTGSNITFHAADRNETVSFPLMPVLPLEEPLLLHRGIYNRIVKQYNNGQPLPVKITTWSDAPAGSGLGSSSTMVVTILKAFAEALNLPLGEYEMAHLAFLIERKDLSLSGGRQDQYASTFGGFNFMEFYADERVIVNPLRIKNWIINELETSMLLFYTGVSRESARIINEQSANTTRGDKISIDALSELKGDALRMKESLLRGEIGTFASLLGKSWEAKKRTANSITNDFLNGIYDRAMNAGALAGKVSGAGGGGFMMFVTDPVKKINVMRALADCQGQFIPFHFINEGTKGWRI
jgi:D-glycero-alpha-D-manno-heptose-7-phosphate kinase